MNACCVWLLRLRTVIDRVMKIRNLLLIGAFAAGAISFGHIALSSENPVPAALTDKAQTTEISYPKTVAELFTSQGCSSCPPANEFINGFNGQTDVLALSYSVDYWDYLGWKDTFGNAEFSIRQREYAQAMQGGVYTPQIIINGDVHSSRFGRSQVTARTLKPARKIQLEKTESNWTATIPQIESGQVTVIVRYQLGISAVGVKAGENKGRTLKLANVVKACEKQTGGRVMFAPPNSGEAVAILVQSAGGGKILTAANIG